MRLQITDQGTLYSTLALLAETILRIEKDHLGPGKVHTKLYGRSSFGGAPLSAPKCTIYYVCLKGEESSQSVGVTAAVAVGILNPNPLDRTAEKQY
jgi:hypothetical protein